MGKFNAYFFFLFLLPTLSAYAQERGRDALFRISEAENSRFELRKARLAAADSFRIPRKITLGPGKEAVLVDYKNRLPYYVTTHNLQARTSTGVEFLQNEIPEGTSLTGDHITVGVWDGGLVRNTHIEFASGRITNKQGSDISDHATHVTGTIAAAGINPQAKGMLPAGKISAYYGFENDLGPMATEAANGLILSNHSYGVILGWEFSDGKWEWFGGADDADSRFGHYSSESASLDNIAYNAPYYTIVRSAGNDRADTGSGTPPPDGPFDCLGPSAVAKNVITVGAITGFDEYEGTQSAVMSSFSSWGPTDDGRIKPDIMGDGVGVFSTSSDSDNAYETLQGTSMSAPNVTGSIALLQQYYRTSADTFMTSAALKSLVLHTAREAGVGPGPDYMFGWGVLNVIDGYFVLKNRNGLDTLLTESTLTDGGQHEYQLFSDGKSPITATIAWTDVPGQVPAEGSTSRMLVNDLDIRLINSAGVEVRPWVLDPSSPSKQASQGDNIRDNVEKIEYPNPDPGLYTLRVTHKNSLSNGAQDYGLTFTGSSIRAPQDVIYWTAAGGDAGGSNWSLSSGGAANPDIQPENKTWVFDNNSALENGNVVTLDGNVTVKNLVWLDESTGIIDLGGDTLFVQHEIISSNAALKIRNGVVVIRSAETDALSLNFDGADLCTVYFDNESPVALMSGARVSALVIDGQVEVTSRQIVADQLTVRNGAMFRPQNCDLRINQKLLIEHEDVVNGSGNHWVFSNAEIDIATTADLKLDSAQFSGNSVLKGSSYFGKGVIESFFTINGTLEADDLKIARGANLIIGALGNIIVNTGLVIASSEAERTSIKGLSADSPAVAMLRFRKLICADFLDLENLVVQTESVVTVGENSTTINVSGVFDTACQGIVFPDFRVTSFCANSAITIENTSIGDVEEYLWDFGNGQFIEGINDVASPIVIFDEPGIFTVRLTVKKGDIEISHEREIEITSNDIPEISILAIEEELVASVSVSQYTWYLNGQIIPDETKRKLTPTASGIYRVAFTQATASCPNRVSGPYAHDLVTGAEEVPSSAGPVIGIFPNPVDAHLTLTGIRRHDRVTLFDAGGKLVADQVFQREIDSGKIDVSDFRRGIFFLHVKRGTHVYRYKIIKK